MSNSTNGNSLWDPKEAAEYLGTTERMLKQLRDQRAIAFVRVGHRTIRYRKEDLDAFIEQNVIRTVGQ